MEWAIFATLLVIWGSAVKGVVQSVKEQVGPQRSPAGPIHYIPRTGGRRNRLRSMDEIDADDMLRILQIFQQGVEKSRNPATEKVNWQKEGF